MTVKAAPTENAPAAFDRARASYPAAEVTRERCTAKK